MTVKGLSLIINEEGVQFTADQITYDEVGVAGVLGDTFVEVLERILDGTADDEEWATSLFDILGGLVETLVKDCKNPDCPIHGKKGTGSPYAEIFAYLRRKTGAETGEGKTGTPTE